MSRLHAGCGAPAPGLPEILVSHLYSCLLPFPGFWCESPALCFTMTALGLLCRPRCCPASVSESVQWTTAFNSMACVWVNVVLVSTGLPGGVQRPPSALVPELVGDIRTLQCLPWTGPSKPRSLECPVPHFSDRETEVHITIVPLPGWQVAWAGPSLSLGSFPLAG